MNENKWIRIQGTNSPTEEVKEGDLRESSISLDKKKDQREEGSDDELGSRTKHENSPRIGSRSGRGSTESRRYK